MKHTPAPWHATPSPKGGHNIYDADNNVPAIARTYRIADDATVEANARLIAAAPDLLKALQIIVANARMVPDPTMDGATDCFAVPLGDIEIVAHAAIAHATGDFAARATGEPEEASAPHAAMEIHRTLGAWTKAAGLPVVPSTDSTGDER